MPLYEPWMNRVYAGSVNVYAGGGTKSMARSDGALNVSAFTAGSLVADAYSTDSISAMVEGMWLYSKKGDVNIKAENNTSTEGIGYKVGGISMIDAGKTDVKSRAGTNGSRQSVAVVIGDEAQISSAGAVNINAINQGKTVANGTVPERNLRQMADRQPEQRLYPYVQR